MALYLFTVLRRSVWPRVDEEEARKDAHDREAIVASLREVLKRGEKSLVGKKGYRRYLQTKGKAFSVDEDRIEKGRTSCGACRGTDPVRCEGVEPQHKSGLN